MEIVLSEARLSTWIAVYLFFLVLAVGFAFALIFMSNIGDGSRYPFLNTQTGRIIFAIYLLGTAAYLAYEFTKIARNRSRYVTYRDGYIHILEQGSIKLDSIRSVTVEPHFLIENLVFTTTNGAKSRVRGHLVKRDLHEIKDAIEGLRKSNRP